ncbi:PHD finger protein 21B isoform X2 [Callithrix jacchus]
MELQSRPEALAVELARHQNGDLKKQLHERQPRIAALSDKQALGVITAVPVTGPQVSSLQRLAGQGAAVLPQVRPKTLIPDSLPIAPGRDRPPKQPPAFQKATVVSIKNPSPALPTANNTVSHVPAPGSQPQALAEPSALTSPLTSAGVAYAIISTSPSNATAMAPSTAVSVVSDSIKVQPLLISADNKVIIIQPQVQAQPESTAESRPPTEEPSQGAQATKKKKEDRPPTQENPEKIAFMVALGLVTTEHLEEIQSKRQERKRRSTANPAYSGLLETERKRLASNYLNNPLFQTARANEDPCWKNEIIHDEHCAACKRGANLQPCGACPVAYHLSCLDPPLKTAPKGVWVCPRCQQKALKKDEGVPWTGMLAIVHSYVTHKTVKEEEKQKLLQRGSELQSEHQQLEEQDRQLASAVQRDWKRPHSTAGKRKSRKAAGKPKVSEAAAEMPGVEDKPAGPPEGYPVIPRPPAGPSETDTGRAAAAGHHDDH